MLLISMLLLTGPSCASPRCLFGAIIYLGVLYFHPTASGVSQPRHPNIDNDVRDDGRGYSATGLASGRRRDNLITRSSARALLLLDSAAQRAQDEMGVSAASHRTFLSRSHAGR